MGSVAQVIPNIMGGKWLHSQITKGSPREQAFKGFAGEIGQRISGREGTGRKRSEQLSSYFERTREGLGEVGTSLAQMLGLQQATIGTHLGEALSSAGVARGHDRAGAFVGAMSPAIGEYLSGITQLGAAQAGTHIQEGMSLMDLLSKEDQVLLALLGLKGEALGGMKGTTELGDLLGLIQTAGSVGAQFVAPGG